MADPESSASPSPISAPTENGGFLCPLCHTHCDDALKTTEGICQLCFEDAEREKAKVRKLREAQITSVLGGPGIFKKAAWSQIQSIPENADVVARCKQFNPRTSNLYLWGKCGRGKTLLAKAIARQWMFEGLSAVVETTSSIQQLMGQDYGHEHRRIIDRLSRVDILVLNDFGRGEIEADLLFLLCDVIENRTDNEKNGMIVTSNLDLASLAGNIGDDRLPSRLRICGEPVEVRGPDWRRQ